MKLSRKPKRDKEEDEGLTWVPVKAQEEIMSTTNASNYVGF